MSGLRALIALPAIAIWLTACGPSPDQVNGSGHEPYASGDYAAALDAYEEARDLAPEPGAPYYNVGNTLYRMESFEESLEQYDGALKYARGDLRSRGFFNRGNAAFRMQQYTQAVEAYKEVLRMNPDDLDAKHNLELALKQLPDQDRDEEQAGAQAQQSPPPQDQPPPPPQDQQDQPPPPPQDQQDQPPPPEPQTEPLTDKQARQALEAIGEDAKTLLEQRQQTLVSPKSQIEFDW